MVPSSIRKPAVVLIAMLLAMLGLAPVAAYHEGDDAEHGFASDAFYDRWARTDLPVEQGVVSRTWMWGPTPYTEGMFEPYTEAPDGERLVQYFDKSRMELTNPAAVDDGLWYVTNGLLVVEMVDGRIQVGDDDFVDADPATIPIAGDPDDAFGPTYADINNYGLRGQPAATVGTTLDLTVQNGTVVQDAAYAEYGITAGYRVTVPNVDHTVASVFWDFMNSAGIVYEGGQYVVADLFINPFYASGYPITEAYWASVMVGGTERDVLWQCFERRCMTYTPGNPDGFLVEAGNVGQHYYNWHYGQVVEPPPPVTETAFVYLVAIGDAGESGMFFGCDDSLIPVEIDIEANQSDEDRIAAVLQAMFANGDTWDDTGLYNVFADSSLTVDNVTIDNGEATVNLSGELVIGGVCDNPRVEEQLLATITQFAGVSSAVVLLNGAPVFEQEPVTENVNIFLVEVGEGEEPNGNDNGDTFGCLDVLVPVSVEITHDGSMEGRITASLNALFGFEHDDLYNVYADADLTVEDVQIINDVVTVNLSGEIGFVGGVCDEPRVIEQFDATVTQFEGIERSVLLIDGAGPFPSQEIFELEGGILATFSVVGEHFNVWVTNEVAIDDILALQANPDLNTFPNAPILFGAGEANHNQPWSWHLDPANVEMVEMSIELCDGRPSFVEGEVEYFVETVERYCPWGAELVEVQDFRDNNNGS
jgi:hypothetical protein